MFQLNTIDYDGGHRKYYDVQIVLEKISKESHWRNLWLKKIQKFQFKAIDLPNDSFKNMWGNDLKFSDIIIIHDFDGEFSDINVGDVVVAKIGYADQDQQRWNRINPFSVSILKQGESIKLVQ